MHSTFTCQRPATMLLRVLQCLAAGLFLLTALQSRAADQTGPNGYLDSIEIEGRQISASGWATTPDSADTVQSVEIYLSQTLALKAVVSHIDRPDIVNTTGRADWLHSGWVARDRLPAQIRSGSHPMHAFAILQSGQRLALHIPDGGNRVSVPLTTSESTTRAESLSGLGAIIVVLILILGWPDRIADALAASYRVRLQPYHIAAAGLVLAFAALVALGLSGSSMRLMFDSANLTQGRPLTLLGDDASVRSDEYMVYTPMAIAQVNHSPSFPVVNRNIGPDGQNMLIVGMTAAPVMHISTLVKPATWGFFFLDLKRALAWYWWLPLFGCLLAVWGMFAFFIPGRWRLGLALAATFCSSAYVAAWSNWPAYAVFFPAMAFNFLMLITAATRTRTLVLLALGLGGAVAGFVLLLYPPQQVSLTYLFAALTAGVALRDRSYLALNLPRLLALALAVAVTAALVLCWWLDASAAIASLRGTLYPGQRTQVTGGDFALWELFRGALNHMTLYGDSGGLTNRSETASFLYFFPVVFLAALYGFARRRVPPWPELLILLFLLFVVCFQLFGLPPFLAYLSLWGRVPPVRADLAMGLASTILCGLVVSSSHKTFFSVAALPAKLLAGAWGLAMLAILLATPSAIRAPVGVALILGSAGLLAAMAYWLLRGRVHAFVGATLLWAVTASLPFNPLTVATGEVAVAQQIKALGPRAKWLVIGSEGAAMTLLAGGTTVVNGVFYYPQASLQRSLTRNAAEAGVMNRYQHLRYLPAPLPGAETYRLASPYPDVVQVLFHPARFDFQLSGADAVLAPASLANYLTPNRSLKVRERLNDWVIFAVTPASANTEAKLP